MERPDRDLLKKLTKEKLIDLVYVLIDGIEYETDILKSAGNDYGYSDNRYEGERYADDIYNAICFIESWVGSIDGNIQEYLYTGVFPDSFKWRR